MSSYVYCLEDQVSIDGDLILLRPAIRSFVSEARTTRSVDGFLILLGVLVFRIEKLVEELRVFRAAGSDPQELLRKVLSCVEVAKALNPLADYEEDVRHFVNSDPRHKALRPYLNLITELLSTMPPSGRRLEIIRPSLDELERIPSGEPKLRTATGGPPPIDFDRVPSEEPKPLRTSYGYHAPVGAAGPSIPMKSRRNVIKKALGYTLLVIVLAGIIYFGYALLIKYGLIEPLVRIPLP